MFTKTLLGVGALLSMAAAVPLQQDKRDIVWVTKTAEAFVTVDVTTTIWLEPGETPPVAPAGGSPGHYGHKHHSHKSHVTSAVTASVPSAPAASSPESTYVAPSPSPLPETTTSPDVAPTPTSTWTAPAATSPAATSPAAAPTYPSSGGGSGQTYTGDMTYYTPGLGSCGETNSASDSIVALAEGMMEASMPASGNPNANPLCGKSITISWQGKTATATIMDTCPGCSGGSLDLTPTLFEKFAPLGEGRLTGMTWQYN